MELYKVDAMYPSHAVVEQLTEKYGMEFAVGLHALSVALVLHEMAIHHMHCQTNEYCQRHGSMASSAYAYIAEVMRRRVQIGDDELEKAMRDLHKVIMEEFENGAVTTH